MKLNAKLATLGGTAIFLLSFASISHAQVIYYDTFTGTNGTSIVGSTPNTDLTGDLMLGYSRGSGAPTFSATGASTSFNGSGALSLSSNSNYTFPTTPIYTVSANLSVNTIGGTDVDSSPSASGGGTTRGTGLGFLSAVPANNASGVDPFSSAFTGFVLQNEGSSTGHLIFVNDGVSSSEPFYTVANFTPANFYNLTYSVNTATGSLLSVNFNGTDVTSSFASAAAAFTTANTQYVDFGSSSNAAGTTGYVENLSLSVAPEPSAWAMLAGGLGILIAIQRRRLRIS